MAKFNLFSSILVLCLGVLSSHPCTSIMPIKQDFDLIKSGKEGDCLADSPMSMLSDEIVSTGTETTLKFGLDDLSTVSNIQENNLLLKDYKIVDNTLYVDVSIQNNFSQLTVSFENKSSVNQHNNDDCAFAGNGMTSSESYYLYHKNGLTYTSSISMDTAINMAGDDPLQVNSMIELASVPDTPVIPIPKIPIEPYVADRITGFLEWKDDDRNVFPLSGVKVSVKCSSNLFSNTSVGGNSWMSTYTDDSGFFNLSSPVDLLDETLEMTLDGENIRVRHVDNSDKNENTSLGFYNHSDDYRLSLGNYVNQLKSNCPIIINTITPQKIVSDFGAATQIFEALYYYSSYAKQLPTDKKITKCTAYYPCYNDYSIVGFPEMNGAYYDGNSNILVPVNRYFVNDVGLTIYQSWDMLGHEYGHHLGKCVKFCPGSGAYTHYMSKSNYETIRKVFSSSQAAMNKALCLTWSESWPTYWAEIAQASFPKAIKEKYSIKRADEIGYIANRRYESNNFYENEYLMLEKGKHFDLAIDYHFNTAGGENCEIAVIRFLYELNRKLGGFSDDEIPNVDSLWELLIDCGDKFYASHENYNDDGAMKFDDVYNYFYNLVTETGSYKSLTIDTLSDIASDYWFAPIKIETKIENGDLYIYWKVHGISEGLTKKCSASLTFYDDGIETIRDNIECQYFTRCEKNFLQFRAKIERLWYAGATNCSIGLSFSPCHYEWPYYWGDTGPYTRIFWKGNDADLSIDTLNGIKLDTQSFNYWRELA